MARWKPDARDRLAGAAIELFSERGYRDVTVADIAARAGLTERTFFNHFADKREVLFGGSEDFARRVLESVRQAPRSEAPLDVVLAAYEATSDFFEARRPFAQMRMALVAAHPELMERELAKMLSLSAALAALLEERGASKAAAVLAAEAGVAIVRVGFEAWGSDAKGRSIPLHLRAARRQLEAVVTRARRSRGR